MCFLISITKRVTPTFLTVTSFPMSSCIQGREAAFVSNPCLTPSKLEKGSNVIDVKSRKLILILIVIILTMIVMINAIMIIILKMITSLNSAQLVSPSRSLSRARVELGLLRAHHLLFKILWELQCLEDQQEGALAIFRADYLLFKI